MQSVPGVAELTCSGPAGRSPELLLELPHGATRRTHFDALRARLEGNYPADLEQFFFVNTDVGAPECAAAIARRLAQRGTRVATLRCLIPRTFIDCNRIVDGARDEGGMTPGLPSYVVHEKDVALLRRLHAEYQEQARRCYAEVCGSGGLALTLHTYAPRNVDIDRIDEGIVGALRRCYEPDRYRRFELRPEVDLICEDIRKVHLAPPGLAEALRQAYAAIDVTLEENRSYRLHPDTMGYVHAAAYPGQVICLELRRDLLADPFSPFEEMRIGAEKTERLAGPIADAIGTGIGRADRLIYPIFLRAFAE